MTAPMTSPRDPAPIPAERMRELLAAGRVHPLLPGHFPVPVILDGQWWHLPEAGATTGARAEAAMGTAPATAVGGVFVPATAEQAARFTVLAQRRGAADQAVRDADRIGPQ